MKKRILLLLSIPYLWLATDAQNVGIGTNTPAFKLDVNGRMRVKTGTLGNVSTSSGIWLEDFRDGTNRIFIGMQDSIRAGFYGSAGGAGWDFNFNATNGHIGIGTIASNKAKLQVHTIGTGTPLEIASGSNLPGISAYIASGNKIGVGFNQRRLKTSFSEGDEYIGNGYSSAWVFTPVDGKLQYSQSLLSGSANTILPISFTEFTIDNQGRLGIGTSFPEASLHLNNSGTFVGGDLLKLSSSSTPMIKFAIGGSERGFINVTDNDLKVGTLAGNDLGRFIVRVNAGDRMFVHPNGYVTIGTSTPASGYLLSINGKAICTELKVQLAGGWPDYVFSEKYKLRSLAELSDFIQLNRHLPNIPSASEIEKNGIEVGDMQKRMMEKIEELTLYIIDLKKDVDELKKKIN